MNVSRALLASAIGLFCLWLSGCGGETAEVQTEPATEEVRTTGFEDKGERAADWAEIDANLNGTIQRMKYGDKSGLYENEFEYLLVKETFDDYLAHGEIKWANADSLSHIEVKQIEFFDQDSAYLTVQFHFEGANGEERVEEDDMMAFYQRGRWIKPYMSRVKTQREYDELVRQADEDSDL